jgi:cell division septum initiation protein DivIVA
MQSTQTIVAFLDVLKTQATPSSDTTSDLSQLEQQIASLTNEQYDEMTKAIKSFCKKLSIDKRTQFVTVLKLKKALVAPAILR